MLVKCGQLQNIHLFGKKNCDFAMDWKMTLGSPGKCEETWAVTTPSKTVREVTKQLVFLCLQSSN